MGEDKKGNRKTMKNKKQKYRSLVKQKFLYKIRHPLPRGYIPIPEFIQEEIRNRWKDYQEKILDVQVHTIGRLL